MINTLESVPPPVAVARGRLKHSWLENEVLNKSPDVVGLLRREVDWPALHRFPIDIQRALSLTEEIEFGFSPAQLVDDSRPLATLPQDQRRMVRSAVHSAYLKIFDARTAAQLLWFAASEMQVTLTSFLDEWNKPDSEISETALQNQWRAVLEKAECLRTALDALPKGIVLP